jgi:elongation factor 2
MPRFRQTAEILKSMDKKDCIRNIGVIAHIDHGKTTMTDSLLFEAGLLPERMAGRARALDYLEEEQKRGITIKTANLSLLHKMENRTFLINLIDTPGHVDFTGKVSRALRSTDGVIVVIDAVEEIMAQTETVTRQALEERVRPVLFINKVDRLIKELNLSPDEIENKFLRIINDFNNLVGIYAEPEFKNNWKINPRKENVVFGSALHKWGITLRTVAQQEKSFSDIIDAYKRDNHENLSKSMPLHSAILDMVVTNIPDPVEAQKYRVPRIWKGDLKSEVGRSMLNCDENGPAVMCVTMAQMIPDVGLVATGRLFSGTVREGDDVHLVSVGKEYKVKQIAIYMSAFREVVDKISCGNIAALNGLDLARAGETIVEAASKSNIVPFEPFSYVSEPVMTLAVEPGNLSDLPKLIEAAERLSIDDPNIAITIDTHTGQYLLSGVGELHLEIALHFLKQYAGGIGLTASNPIVAYRETVLSQGRIVMANSPNKQNSFWAQVMPLQKEIVGLIERGDSGEKTKAQAEAILRQNARHPLEETQRVWALDDYRNILTGLENSVHDIHGVEDSIISGFHWACKRGPLCEEPLRRIEVRLIDAKLHNDAGLRKSAQVSRAFSRAILGSCLTAEPVLLEPLYKIEVSTPARFFGACTSTIIRRRGRIERTENKGVLAVIIGYVPVAETSGLSAEIRSATSGRALWQLTFDRWEKIPERVAAQLIEQIRKKRGLPTEVPRPEKFIDETQ